MVPIVERLRWQTRKLMSETNLQKTQVTKPIQLSKA
jgi:hypothetical protein